MRGFWTFVLAIGALCVAGVARAEPDPVSRDLAPPELVTADGAPVDVATGHAAPYLHDMDGDGKRDLLVGMLGGGQLWIYRNVGADDAPVFAAHEVFRADGEDATVPSG